MQRVGYEHRSGQRIELIDFLRGFCLAAMTIDHLPDSLLEKLTWQTFGFVSAAEGFVFLSGLVLGGVYGRTAVYWGLSKLTGRAIRRLRTIYLTNVTFISLAFMAARHGLADLGPGEHASWSLWGKSLLLIAAPGYFEILRLYCVLFLFIPLIFWALLRNRTPELVVASFVLWLLVRLGYGATLPDTVYFDLMSWQFLFVVGICCGFRQPFFANTEKTRSGNILLAIGAALVVTCFVLRHGHAFFGVDFSPYFHWLKSTQGRRSLPFGRLVDFAAVAYVIYRFRSVFERLSDSWPGRALVFLGQHSLPVFVWTVFLTMVISATNIDDHLLGNSGLRRSMLDIVVLASCFLPAWLHSRLGHLRNLVRQAAATNKPVELHSRGVDSSPGMRIPFDTNANLRNLSSS